jgi:hypothetical protein
MASIINASTSGAGGVVTTADASGQLELQTAGTTAVTVTSGQNVGIGASSPGYKLDIRSAGGSLPVAPDGIRVNLSGYTNDVYSVRLFTGADSGGVPYSQLMGPRDANGWLAFTMGSSDQERMRITSTGDLRFDSGYGSVATAYGCRAWVNFDGTTNTGGFCTIRGSGNVTSVADNGTGDYDVNFSTAMPDSNYSVIGTAKASNTTNYAAVSVASTDAGSTNLVKIFTMRQVSGNPARIDFSVVNVAVIR